MKKILTLALGLLLATGLSAKTLKVYSTSGNVSKKSGSSWVALAKNQTVSDTETVKINPSSTLRVMDSESRQIYTFSSPGEHKLADLLRASAKENSSMMGKIGAESKKQMAASGTKSHKAVGAAKRGSLDEDLIEELYSALYNGFAKGENVGGLSARKIKAGDEEFYPEITNSSAEPLYVNIFVKEDGGTWAHILNFTDSESALVIPAGETVSLDYLVIAEMPGDCFAVVGFDEPIDGDELSEMFEAQFEPEEASAEGVSLYFLK